MWKAGEANRILGEWLVNAYGILLSSGRNSSPVPLRATTVYRSFFNANKHVRATYPHEMTQITEALNKRNEKQFLPFVLPSSGKKEIPEIAGKLKLVR